MKPRPLELCAVFGGALLFAALGAWLEGREELAPLRERMQVQEVPAPLLDTGRLGALLQRADLVDNVPNDGTVYPIRFGTNEDEPLVFRRKAQVGGELYRASTGVEPSFPDSALARDSLPGDELLVISVATDERHLETLHTRHSERLERWASVTMYRGEEELFQSRAGIRLHGGRSRHPGFVHSYRLHLRDRYGDMSFPEDFLFGGAIDPLHNLIVRRVLQNRFSCNFGYDVFRRLGVEVPHTEPAYFFLNGKPMGIYFLSEHLGLKQLRSRFGHGDWLVYRNRGVASETGQQEHERLIAWLLDEFHELRMEEVDRYVDVDAISRYLLGVAFCGVIDWEQGASYLDLSDPQARWTWIAWDLDRGSWTSRDNDVPAFGIVHDDPRQRRTSAPAILFRGLIENDPAYRAYLRAMVVESLNHVLTNAFLEERMGYYEDLGARAGWAPSFSQRRVFFSDRARVVLEDLAPRIGAGEVVSLSVSGLTSGGLRVDGHAQAEMYRGHYYEGDTVRIAVEEPADNGGWLVNGDEHPPGPLELVLTEDTVVIGRR